jgi:hypothetical protein
VCCRRLGQPFAAPYLAWLVDLSRDGVNLLVRKPLAAGTCLDVELVPPDGGPRVVRVARVRRTEPAANGLTHLGCCWAVPLTSAELRRFA